MSDARDILAALRARGGHQPVACASPPPPPPTGGSAVQPPATNASAILQRLRQRSAPPPPPKLSIVSNGRHAMLMLFRWRLAGGRWFVSFNRETFTDEYVAMDRWCRENCAGGFRASPGGVDQQATGWEFYDETDWTLFMTTFK